MALPCSKLKSSVNVAPMLVAILDMSNNSSE